MWLSSCNIQGTVQVLSEISEFDIPDRQLLATGAKPAVSISTDIGKAKITHTIFGRARVRIIRERDNKRRAWLLGALAVIAIVTAAWQGWIMFQQAGSHPASLPLSARIRISAPTTQPENLPPAATPPSVTNKPPTPLQAEINKLMASQKSAPQPPPGSNAPGQTAAKPVTAQPLAASKPQTAPLATSNNPLRDQTDKPLPPRLSAPVQPVVPAVAPPRATSPVSQPAASSPAAVAPFADPLAREDTPALSPAGDNQPADPVNAQP
jgi:hypothetical protein